MADWTCPLRGISTKERSLANAGVSTFFRSNTLGILNHHTSIGTEKSRIWIVAASLTRDHLPSAVCRLPSAVCRDGEQGPHFTATCRVFIFDANYAIPLGNHVSYRSAQFQLEIRFSISCTSQ